MNTFPQQRGTALFVALILLIGVTMLSLAGVATGTMELRMARNHEDTSHTFQTALAAVDYVISDSANLPTTGPLMTPQAVSLGGETLFDTSGGDAINATAARLEDCVPPPRARGHQPHGLLRLLVRGHRGRGSQRQRHGTQRPVAGLHPARTQVLNVTERTRG